MKLLRNFLKGLSLTTALFVVQACYGTPQSALMSEGGVAPMYFSLVSDDTGEPLEGIVIYGNPQKLDYNYTSPLPQLGITGADGKCRVDISYIKNMEGPFLTFKDPDGKYATKDTTLADLREREIIIKLESSK
ncbi:MAG: hypothetical protein J6Y83_04135 [Bacteroidales bacterium]|nr:hypothetical protein [Bacteroidales bacterium]